MGIGPSLDLARGRGLSLRGTRSGRSHAVQSSREDGAVRVRALPRDDDVRREGILGGGGEARATRGRRHRGDVDRRRRELRRYGRRLLRGRVRAAPGQGAPGARPAARSARRGDQGPRPDRPRGEPGRPLAGAHPRRHRREPEAPRARSRGPVPDPRRRPRHPHRGDRAGARRRGAIGQGALRRVQQPPRLAGDEGDRVRRRGRPRAVPKRAGLLLDRGARHRAGDRPDGAGRGARDPPVEPARRRAPLRQVRSGQTWRAGGRAPKLLRLPPRRSRPPPGGALRAPEGRRRQRHLGRAGRAGVAPDASVRDQRDHRREDAASSLPTTSRPPRCGSPPSR